MSARTGASIGSRVRLKTNGVAGTVKFSGITTFASGVWLGVALDEPVGKHDGAVEGRQYFVCRPNCGVFVKPDKLEPLPGGAAARATCTREPKLRAVDRNIAPTDQLQRCYGGLLAAY